MMVNPWGTILTSGGDEEVILRAEIDLNVLKDARERFPALTDRLDWLSTGCSQYKNTSGIDQMN